MESLQVLTQENGDNLLLTLKGNIDEFSIFANLNLKKYRVVEIDLSQVTSINSVGIREWMSLLDTLSTDSFLKLSHCPRPIVEQMNILDGFVPEKCEIKSFYVPYFCESCNKEWLIEFINGKNFHFRATPPSESMNFPVNVTCSLCQGPIQIDVMESKYFRFLKSKGASL